ncbi:hypothetical protein [Oryzifoliimicrobium ureilyticus]|uniref:hypothetical protein n=1 Tax=Oryzifoliimicrobium ureilyticus TaxID=3113724 RepID=UPI0030763F6F
MTEDLRVLSSGLEALLKGFADAETISDDDVLEISGKHARTVIKTLRYLKRHAILMEHEMAIHRQHENSQIMGKEMEAAANAFIRDVVQDPEGRVVTVDFGRRQ